MPESGDPIERQREAARQHADGAFQEAVAGAGTGAVPSPAKVSVAVPPGQRGRGASVAAGGSPERHPRPTFRSSQLDGLDEEA